MDERIKRIEEKWSQIEEKINTETNIANELLNSYSLDDINKVFTVKAIRAIAKCNIEQGKSLDMNVLQQQQFEQSNIELSKSMRNATVWIAVAAIANVLLIAFSIYLNSTLHNTLP